MLRKWCGDCGWFSFTTSKPESTVILDDDDDDDREVPTNSVFDTAADGG